MYHPIFSTKIIATLLVIMLTQGPCGRKCNCVGGHYEFTLPVRVYPNLDTVDVLDTTYFEIDAAMPMRDLRSNNDINYKNVEKIGVTVYYSKFDYIANQWHTDTIDNFLTFPVNGLGFQEGIEQRLMQFFIKEQSGRLRFLLAMIPRKPGLYAMFIFESGTYYKDRDDDCSMAFFDITLSETNRHTYLDPLFNSNPTNRSYYFVVR